MFRGYPIGRAASRRAFLNAGLAAVCIAAAVIAMPAAAADAAVPVPFVSTATSVSAGAAVTDGTMLTVTFGATPVLAGSYSLTLTDGSDGGTLSSAAGNLTAAVTGSSIVFTVHGAPSMSVGSGLSLAVPLEILQSTGVSDGSGDGWDLVASGQVTVDASNNCSTVGLTRVFGGSNCDIGFVDTGPLAPGVFDVIPFPTQDLPGPPDDNAPEVITNCEPGSTDWVYDVNTEAQLGANPCGNNPDETAIGNTNSNTLDYIPTPNLAPFEDVGVVETIPGSSYLSGTVVPPQLSGVSVSGDQATFTYYGEVVCETGNSDPDEWSQFNYVTPYTKTNLSMGDLVYPTAISCPPPGGGNSITVTWSAMIPVSSGVRFKYTGFGSGHSIVGAPGDPSAGEREASESAYAGPGATIDSFTPQSTTLPTSSGENVDVTLSTSGAQTCGLSAVSLPAGAATPSLPSVASCGGSGTITVPTNTTYATNVVYTITLTAAGAAGTPPAIDAVTITVPAAPLPIPAVMSAPTISGTAVLGQTLTENHGSWASNPTSYSYQWEDCDGGGSSCVAIAGATAQTYAPTAADAGHALSVQETASNASGSATATAAATTTIPNLISTTPAPVPAPGPAPAPVEVSPPTVSGTPVAGQTLTEGHGSWSNTPTSYAYRWERCDENGNNCVAIIGASAQTDKLTTADVGHRLRVQESASNVSGGGAAAISSPTAPVSAARTSSKHHAAPNTLLLEHQVSAHNHRATFRFKATGTATRFECALVRKPTRRGARTPAPKYVSCHSPKTFTGLHAGSYVLYVRAIGPGGADKTPATYDFKIT
jgi:hypothetical protein